VRRAKRFPDGTLRPADRIPADDNLFDVLTSRPGSSHWVKDARRVARPEAVLIQLNPLGAAPPPWPDDLPEALPGAFRDPMNMREVVEEHLARGGADLHCRWTFDA
jgi:hypothetical protein